MDDVDQMRPYEPPSHDPLRPPIFPHERYDDTTKTKCPYCNVTRNWKATRDHIPTCPKKPLLLKQLDAMMPRNDSSPRYMNPGTYVSGARFTPSQMPSASGYQRPPGGYLPVGQGSTSQGFSGTSARSDWFGGNPVATQAVGYMPAGAPQAQQMPTFPYAQPPSAPYAQPPGASYAQPPGASYAQPPGTPYAQPPGVPYVQQPGAPYAQPPGTQQPPGALPFMYPYMPMPNQANPSHEDPYERRGRKRDRRW